MVLIKWSFKYERLIEVGILSAINKRVNTSQSSFIYSIPGGLC